MLGRTLGRYQITDQLGAGGMGEVWRARDARLGRDVAIKILPPAFAQDPERLARFEREAQVLAALNHPNIAAVYGLEEADGAPCLVLEMVPGETLRGPVSPDEALLIARQIIDALEEAHEKGIVHRDLKPANIKITPEGKVKVLDFGLAKALEGDAAAHLSTQSPTLTVAALTRGGVLLGTAAYMSPEQARGKPVDKRSDIWAFGCVLYEMLTGKQAFGGETVTDSLAAIVKNEPDWSALPESTPPQVRRLLQRCLEKDPKRRLRDIGEARILLDEPAPAITPQPASIPHPPAPIPRMPWAVAAAAAAAAAVGFWGWLGAPEPAARPVMRLTAALPSTTGARWLAVSRDGTRLAFRGDNQIYVRSGDQFEAKRVPGTEGAFGVFLSPDGQWIAYGDRSKLKKVPVNGGAPITLCDGGAGYGASWGPDGNIVFATAGSWGLKRVSSAGGKPEDLTKPDVQKGETHRWPEVLPDGSGVLFTIGGAAFASWDDAKIAVLDLKTGRQRVLVEGGTVARYVPTGHLVYWRAGSLFAVPFDLRRLEVTGQAVPVLEGVAGVASVGFADFGISNTGMLAYVPGGAEGSNMHLAWVDRQGKAQLLAAPPKPYYSPRVSPDGRRVAMSMGDARAASDIWVYDVDRSTLTRVTFQAGAWAPAWTPDGRSLVYRSKAGDKGTFALAAADGSAGVQTLALVDMQAFGGQLSPDGKLLVFPQPGKAGKIDLWTVAVDTSAAGEPKPSAFLETAFDKFAPAFSPDGRWIAYQSSETGQMQVYVQGAPRAGGSPAAGKWQISTDGGTVPVWARSGRELFYRNADKVMAVEVVPGPSFRAGTPKTLFEGRYARGGYDAAPDGKRFLMMQSAQSEAGPAQLHVVMNWFEELRRRAPANGR